MAKSDAANTQPQDSQEKEDSPRLKRQKKQLHRETFHLKTVEGGITLFRFERLSREVLIQWGDLVRVQKQDFPQPVRLLFDFRGAGAPSRYMADRMPRVLEDLALPENTRVAYLIDDSRLAQFIHNAVANWPFAETQIQSFINYDPALNWLAEDGTSPPDDAE